MENKILYGNCIRMLARAREAGVVIDASVTSPPYKDEDGYTPQLMMAMLTDLLSIHRDGSYMFLNFGHLVAFKSRPFYIVELAERVGWSLHDTIVWVKPQYTPITTDYHVNNLFEFVFMFRKGERQKLNRLEVGIPYRDKSNVKRYGGGRDLHCGGNVWEIGYDTIQSAEDKAHPHRFPDELVRRCLRLIGGSDWAGRVVCDPFGGSFTTMKVGNELGANVLSCDYSIWHCLNASYRLRKPVECV